ncbi:MAG TPA: hypothetical protein VNE42_09755 [Acidimicrobiales bacterium]|nr:hypothetical protein [Acidimicrobiales bacterium]
MTSKRQRQLQRERRAIAHRRADYTATNRAIEPQNMRAGLQGGFARKRRRHISAAIMWSVAACLAIAHLFEHTGTLRIMSLGLEDILIGWPMAGVLTITGAVVYGT